MENSGVICDVGTCKYNIGCTKCDLNQIKVTEQSNNGGQGVANPHYCQSYEEKSTFMG